MRLQYNTLVGIEEMENAFPRTIQPALSETDYLINLTPNATVDSGGYKVEPLLNVLYAQALFVPYNQVYSGATTVIDNGAYIRTGLPQLIWQTFNVSGTAAVQAFAYRPWSMQHFDVLCKDEPNADSMTLLAVAALSNAGFTAIINKNHWQNILVNPGLEAAWDLEWQVGTKFWRVVSQANLPLRVDASDDGTHWKTINGKIKQGSNPFSSMGNSDPEDNSDAVYVEVLCMNGQMLIAVGGTSNPMVVTVPGGAYPIISGVAIHAQNFTQFSFQVHPVVFNSQFTYTSLQKPFGVPPLTQYRYRLLTALGLFNMSDGDEIAEDGWLILVETINGETANPSYRISAGITPVGSYNGVNYTANPCAISRMTMIMDGIFQTRAYNPRRIIPKEVREQISFDLGGMSIRHTADVTLSNFRGIGWWNTHFGLRGFGNQHVIIRMGWNHMPGDMDGGLGYQHFYGYCTRYRYHRSQGGRSHLTLSCVDQMQQLADSTIASPSDLDGANHYAAMAWLAQKAGISPLQFAFARFVPTLDGGNLANDPGGIIDLYGVSSYDPDPYFLPLGQGLHPWTPRDRTMPNLTLMQQVRTTTGFLLFIDRYGYLRYEQWIPPFAQLPVKQFNEVATSSAYADGGDLSEMFNLEVVSSTDETRNQVIVIGIDSFGPDWSPLVIKYEDGPSITLPFGVAPTGNYIGYAKAFVWMDSRFAEPVFANRAALTMFEFMRLPEYTIHFDAWLQVDLFPMDTIYVNDWRSNSSGIPFYVMSISNTLSVMGNQIELTTSVTGKFLV